MLEPIPFAGYVEIDEISYKPIAWINEYNELESFNPDNRQDWIPLYSHPINKAIEK
jgi:hypothetical protein